MQTFVSTHRLVARLSEVKHANKQQKETWGGKTR
ncbi:hypothetical protein [Shewanella phage FishSpeaker]|nr:hypothetical protein [Shewanella phage FishSpeaker]